MTKVKIFSSFTTLLIFIYFLINRKPCLQYISCSVIIDILKLLIKRHIFILEIK